MRGNDQTLFCGMYEIGDVSTLYPNTHSIFDEINRCDVSKQSQTKYILVSVFEFAWKEEEKKKQERFWLVWR